MRSGDVAHNAQVSAHAIGQAVLKRTESVVPKRCGPVNAPQDLADRVDKAAHEPKNFQLTARCQDTLTQADPAKDSFEPPEDMRV